MQEQDILDKLKNFTEKFKQQLKSKGLIIPIKVPQGYKVEDYLIKRKPDGYAIIHSPTRAVIHDHINLLQTAIIIANSLACKKALNYDALSEDFQAASKQFDVLLFKKRIVDAKKKNDGFNIDLYNTRLYESQILFKQHMNNINEKFYRLTRPLYQNPNK
jgi:hypothetical protein